MYFGHFAKNGDDIPHFPPYITYCFYCPKSQVYVLQIFPIRMFFYHVLTFKRILWTWNIFILLLQFDIKIMVKICKMSMISNFLKLHHFGEFWVLFETLIFNFFSLWKNMYSFFRSQSRKILQASETCGGFTGQAGKHHMETLGFSFHSISFCLKLWLCCCEKDHIPFFYPWYLYLFESFTLQICSPNWTHKTVLNHTQLNNRGPHRSAMAPQLSWICAESGGSCLLKPGYITQPIRC